MEEISLHILDLAQNSIKAEASLIKINVVEDVEENVLSFTIEDNGCGMSEEFLKTVENPFATTRTTRKVGLGIPLTKQACLDADGSFKITSKENEGTCLTATFSYNHIDRQPLGDMKSTILILITQNISIDFIYTHTYNGKHFVLDTREIREAINPLPLDNPDIYEWLSEFLSENYKEIYN